MVSLGSVDGIGCDIRHQHDNGRRVYAALGEWQHFADVAPSPPPPRSPQIDEVSAQGGLQPYAEGNLKPYSYRTGQAAALAERGHSKS